MYVTGPNFLITTYGTSQASVSLESSPGVLNKTLSPACNVHIADLLYFISFLCSDVST